MGGGTGRRGARLPRDGVDLDPGDVSDNRVDLHLPIVAAVHIPPLREWDVIGDNHIVVTTRVQADRAEGRAATR